MPLVSRLSLTVEEERLQGREKKDLETLLWELLDCTNATLQVVLVPAWGLWKISLGVGPNSKPISCSAVPEGGDSVQLNLGKIFQVVSHPNKASQVTDIPGSLHLKDRRDFLSPPVCLLTFLSLTVRGGFPPLLQPCTEAVHGTGFLSMSSNEKGKQSISIKKSSILSPHWITCNIWMTLLPPYFSTANSHSDRFLNDCAAPISYTRTMASAPW